MDGGVNHRSGGGGRNARPARRGELYMAALYFRVDNMILNMISIKDNGDMAALMFLFPSLYIFILRK